MKRKIIVECINNKGTKLLALGKLYYATEDDNDKENYIINLEENKIKKVGRKTPDKKSRKNIRFKKERFRENNFCKLII